MCQTHRREFLSNSLGFTGLALAAMLQRDGYASPESWSPPDGRPHFTKAKSVIWMFMNGGVSHMETFDPKPQLTKFAGKTIAEGPVPDAQDSREAEGRPRDGGERCQRPAAERALSLASRLPAAWPKRHRDQRLAAAHSFGGG